MEWECNAVKEALAEAQRWYNDLSEEDKDLADKTIRDLQAEHCITEQGAFILLHSIETGGDNL